jgi:hypothetical protein
MRIKWALLVVSMILLFNNCGQFKSIGMISANSSLGGGLPPDNPILLLGQALYQTNCATCHGPLASSSKRGKTTSEIETAIGSQPSMANLNFLTAAEVDSISVALNTSVPALVSGEAASYKPVITNRYALASVLQEFFVADNGGDANDTKIQGLITSLVLNHAEAFGGNCSRNDPGCIPKPCGISGSTCIGQLNTNQSAEITPSAGTVRKGYMIQVCEQILSVDKSVQNLLGKAAISSATAPSDASITALLQYALPGQPVDPATLDKLKAVAASGAQANLGSLDQWRFVILPICESNALDLL